MIRRGRTHTRARIAAFAVVMALPVVGACNALLGIDDGSVLLGGGATDALPEAPSVDEPDGPSLPLLTSARSVVRLPRSHTTTVAVTAAGGATYDTWTVDPSTIPAGVTVEVESPTPGGAVLRLTADRVAPGTAPPPAINTMLKFTAAKGGATVAAGRLQLLVGNPGTLDDSFGNNQGLQLAVTTSRMIGAGRSVFVIGDTASRPVAVRIYDDAGMEPPIELLDGGAGMLARFVATLPGRALVLCVTGGLPPPPPRLVSFSIDGSTAEVPIVRADGGDALLGVVALPSGAALLVTQSSDADGGSLVPLDAAAGASLDFTPVGVVSSGGNAYIEGLSRDGDGGVVVRIADDGAVDPAFGERAVPGQDTSSFLAILGGNIRVAVDGDGGVGVLVLGSMPFPGSPGTDRVLRVAANGGASQDILLDTTMLSVALGFDGDGNLLVVRVAQQMTGGTALERVVDGGPDQSFGLHGVTQLTTSWLNGNGTVLVDPDGLLLVLMTNNAAPAETRLFRVWP